MRTAGMLCVVAGIFLQLWALKALTTRVITGVPEIFNGSKTTLVIHGPFSHVRHPTYVSHTIVFIGIFLWTGIVATGFVGILDFIVVCLIIIPMEENELLHRFGDDYRAYMARTRRFIPRLREQVPTEKEANQADTGNSSKLA
jgi:protein-S-isoprenylcysteine O-methyltransferase Ste14